MPISREQYLEDLIGEGEAVTIRVPPALRQKLYELGHRRFGYLKKNELIPRAIVYAAALGTLSWSLQYKNGKIKPGPRPGTKKKKTGKKQHGKGENSVAPGGS